MKFFNFFAAAALTSIASVSAYETTEKQVVDILIDYSITQTPELTRNDVAEWINGDEVTIEYHVNNNEAEEITVIGVTGQFTNPVTNEVVTNLTQGRVGPLTIAPGTSGSFKQNIGIDLVPDNYELVPQVFIAHQDLIKVIPCRGQLASVSDKVISFLDPRLIFLELVLLASLGGVAYLAYEIWGKKYLHGVSAAKAKKTQVSAPASAGAGAGAGAGASTASGYNVDWLPEGHLKQKKTKKVA
ncbi:uncharacterized protein LODBEIA_P36200 [Lodderomyces beijingensis]|uniref:Increased recombination centers protein 22 n=1 Tax=Lodderomyces beijingensis TaxID=1775926 RepID=A0ABP0ZQL4_9ASCO